MSGLLCLKSRVKAKQLQEKTAKTILPVFKIFNAANARLYPYYGHNSLNLALNLKDETAKAKTNYKVGLKFTKITWH